MATSPPPQTDTPPAVANDDPLDLSKGLSGADLARRFIAANDGKGQLNQVARAEGRYGVNSEKFQMWSAKHDPDRLEWKKEGEGKLSKYFPIIE